MAIASLGYIYTSIAEQYCATDLNNNQKNRRNLRFARARSNVHRSYLGHTPLTSKLDPNVDQI